MDGAPIVETMIPKRFVGRKASSGKQEDASAGPTTSSSVVLSAASGSRLRKEHTIPNEILEDEELNKHIGALPSNYGFEIHKTIWRVQTAKAKCVALQFPEGLLMFSCIIAEIIEQFCPTVESTIILGDVTYGACCVDDYTAKSLGADFLVHYGHSCLIPVDQCSMNILYVFVDISIDVSHFVNTVVKLLNKDWKLMLVGTIQFAAGLRSAKEALEAHFSHVEIPQEKPLSRGEILGCTAPRLEKGKFDCIVYLADGRFHLESIMIANPDLPAFKYDPYSKELTQEYYDHSQMLSIRRDAISRAAKSSKWGLILGTLGHQGSPNILSRIEDELNKKGIPFVVVLLSEIFPHKLALFKDVGAWVQVACPRLSIDWGYAFDTPLLSPYEAFVALEEVAFATPYPMDFYSSAGGPWSVRYGYDPLAKFKAAQPKLQVQADTDSPSQPRACDSENAK
eukprot:ANDGO_07126.mRNA.1 Diphthamide biosynthesis protein 1